MAPSLSQRRRFAFAIYSPSTALTVVLDVCCAVCRRCRCWMCARRSISARRRAFLCWASSKTWPGSSALAAKCDVALRCAYLLNLDCARLQHKSDLFPPTSGGAEQMAKEMGVPFPGSIPHDTKLLVRFRSPLCLLCSQSCLDFHSGRV